jgi:hypothetical protein
MQKRQGNTERRFTRYRERQELRIELEFDGRSSGTLHHNAQSAIVGVRGETI